jgi:hypothetical protein
MNNNNTPSMAVVLMGLSFVIPVALILITLTKGAVEMSIVISGLTLLQAVAFSWLLSAGKRQK